MIQEEPNPYAPPETPAELSNSRVGLRLLAWSSLLLPYALLPLFMLLPYAAGGIIGFILFMAVVPMAVTVGVVCAEGFELIPFPYSYWLIGFYMVTIMFEYATLFDTFYPNFSWR